MLMHPPGNLANPSALNNELVTRSSPVCSVGKLLEDEYNLGLHIAALFIILTLSILGIHLQHPTVRASFPANAFFFHII